jgi:redox-regulated HSP33 family molecular chaperone
METVSMLWATDIKAECPHCHEKVGGFLSDPRGHEVECEFCEKHFKIHSEADVELGL